MNCAKPPPKYPGVFGSDSDFFPRFSSPVKFSIPLLKAIVDPTVAATVRPALNNLPPFPPRNLATPFAPTSLAATCASFNVPAITSLERPPTNLPN